MQAGLGRESSFTEAELIPGKTLNLAVFAVNELSIPFSPFLPIWTLGDFMAFLPSSRSRGIMDIAHNGHRWPEVKLKSIVCLLFNFEKNHIISEFPFHDM